MRRISVLSPCYTAWLAWTYDTSVMTKSVAAEEFLFISPNKQRTGSKEKQEEEQDIPGYHDILAYVRIS